MHISQSSKPLYYYLSDRPYITRVYYVHGFEIYAWHNLNKQTLTKDSKRAPFLVSFVDKNLIEFPKIFFSSLDEGMASVDDEIPLYYGERSCFWIKITCSGSPGHGSRSLIYSCI